MDTTTLRVSRRLHDRLSQRAKARGTTLSGAIEQALDLAERQEFWAQAAATMASAGGPGGSASRVDDFPATLRDGLDLNETWNDVW
jgi:hypothetical protein